MKLAANAAALLVKHTWPGNVRELKNAMERAAVLVRGNVVRADDLDFVAAAGSDSVAADWPDEDIPSAIARLEAMLIRRALARSNGNRTEAARALGIHRQLLYAKMKRYGLDMSEDRTEGVGAADMQDQRLTRCRADDALNVLETFDGAVANANDAVIGLQTGMGGGRIGHDRTHHRHRNRSPDRGVQCREQHRRQQEIGDRARCDHNGAREH